MPTTLTNKNNLPQIIFDACKVDNHVTRGDISVTQLIDAPQIRVLRKSHEIEEDISDRIWMLLGSAMHNILERAEINHYQARQILQAAEALDKQKTEPTSKVAEWLRKFTQKTFPAVFESKNLIESTLSITVDGMEISGTMDKYDFDKKTLEDYKITGSYAFVYEESKKKWYAQQNIYAYMLREHGYEVTNANIIAFFKDWSKYKKLSSRDYPESPVMTIPVKLLPHEEVGKYIKSRIEKHRRSMNGDVVECTGKERWATADAWAVMKKGAVRAVRKLDSPQDAEKFILDNSGFKYPAGSLSVQFRPGEQVRCENYCPVRNVCPQYAKYKSIIEKNAEI